MMRNLALLLLVFVCPAVFASPPGPIEDSEPPISDPPFTPIQSGAAISSSKIATFNTDYGVVTMDLATNSIYQTTSNGIFEASITSAMGASGFNGFDLLNDVDFFPGNASFMFFRDVDRPDHTSPFGGACDLAPCRTIHDPVDFRMIQVPDYEFNGNWTPQITSDQMAFEDWRDGRCDDFMENVIDSSLATPSAAACQIPTPHGRLACLGAVAWQAWQGYRRASSQTDCESNYPGPGRWRGSTQPVQ